MLSTRKSSSWLSFLSGITLAVSLVWAPVIVFCQDGHQATEKHAEGDHELQNANHGDAGTHHGHEHCIIGENKTSDHILHHIADSHDWHIFELAAGTCPDGHKMYTPYGINLPWIVYNSDKGLDFFTTPHAADLGYTIHHGKVTYTNKEATLIDFSITKTALHILLVFILLTFIMISVGKSFKRNEGKAPKGIQSFFEPIIVFVRDDIGKTYLPNKYRQFTPYLLTVFFFIWFSNLFGLTPLNSNIAGNISITLALALLSFILIMANSTKDFWVHIFWFPGVPIWVKPLMLVVEFMGVITKPAALAIRLFANITAGHFMVLSLIGLIFILGDNGNSVGGAGGGMLLAVPFTLFIFSLEMIVGIVQAYVFTLLTAVFIGQAMESHSHDHGSEHSHSH